MKTYSPKQSDIKHEWYLVDLKGKTLGKTATKIADILRGKTKATFSPHLDCGDYVVIINAKELHLTGNKWEQKEYHTHSRYPGGLKTATAKEVREKHPERIVEHAVAGMIPHTKLKKDILKKLKVYSGTDHPHEAQNPKPLEI
jgi:large subunit ribosomal protein L13